MDKIDKRRKENPKKGRFEMRTDTNDEELFDNLNAITGEDRSTMVRNALKLYYQIKRASGNY